MVILIFTSGTWMLYNDQLSYIMMTDHFAVLWHELLFDNCTFMVMNFHGSCMVQLRKTNTFILINISMEIIAFHCSNKVKESEISLTFKSWSWSNVRSLTGTSNNTIEFLSFFYKRTQKCKRVKIDLSFLLCFAILDCSKSELKWFK